MVEAKVKHGGDGTCLTYPRTRIPGVATRLLRVPQQGQNVFIREPVDELLTIPLESGVMCGILLRKKKHCPT